MSWRLQLAIDEAEEDRGGLAVLVAAEEELHIPWMHIGFRIHCSQWGKLGRAVS
jgi:hypothetical protein